MNRQLLTHLRLVLGIVLLVLLAALLLPEPVRADDCLSDPLNAADCMRTGGFRQSITIILGVAATGGVILTNTIGQIMIGLPPAPQTPPQTPTPTPPQPQQPPAQVRPPQPQPPKQPPQQPPEQPQPPQQPQQPPDDSSWLNFDNLKRLVDYPNKLFGLYTHLKLTPDAIEAWKKASQAWHLLQNKGTAQAYIDATRKRMDPGGKLGGALDKAGKLMDAVDAIFKAQDVIEKRGYTGWEKVGAYYVEGVNKVLTTMLTKNPIVSVIDQVAGDLTGVNIENTIRAGEEQWHQVTKEYANNIYNLDAMDAEIASKDNALRYIRKMKQMIKTGQISREDGAARARRIYNKFLR